MEDVHDIYPSFDSMTIELEFHPIAGATLKEDSMAPSAMAPSVICYAS